MGQRQRVIIGNFPGRSGIIGDLTMVFKNLRKVIRSPCPLYLVFPVLSPMYPPVFPHVALPFRHGLAMRSTTRHAVPRLFLVYFPQPLAVCVCSLVYIGLQCRGLFIGKGKILKLFGILAPLEDRCISRVLFQFNNPWTLCTLSIKFWIKNYLAIKNV